MSGALDHATHLRHRRALVKSRFTIAEAYVFLAALEKWSEAIIICPVCMGRDVSCSAQHFACGVKTNPKDASGPCCGAQGDVVDLIKEARGISEDAAISLIEQRLNGEVLCE